MAPTVRRSGNTDLLIRSLDLLEPIGPDERAALSVLPLRTVRLPAGSHVARQGDSLSTCSVVLDGLLCRYRTLAAGQRQIFSFHYPGDMTGIETLRFHEVDHNICTLSECRIAIIPHPVLERAMNEFPSLASAFWKIVLMEGAVFREWLAGIGRRTALQGLAHLFCEIYVRMKAMRLTTGTSFHLPLTQTDLADALGLSLVHVNRMLGELRRAGLLDVRHHRITVGNWQELQILADFDPAYLRLRSIAPLELH